MQRFCSSSLTAATLAAALIKAGPEDVVIAGAHS